MYIFTKYLITFAISGLFSSTIPSHAGNSDMLTVPSTQSINFRNPCSGVLPWSSITAYNAGQYVIYNGRLYVAKWWTMGEAPGGVSGVWEDKGPCGW